MVQQIKFIIHRNIQPLPALYFTQGQGHRSKVKVKDLKKILLTREHFLREVTHEYGDHLIRFSAFHR